MILTGSQIIKEVSQGSIHIDPFDVKLVNPNSYNYRLNDYLFEIEDPITDPRQEQHIRKIQIPKTGYTLEPGQFYLGSTYEIIGSDFFVPSLIGRSSLGRLGLFLQITADLGHIGTLHNWTLELTVVQPLIVYPFMRIGQVSFWVTEGLTLLEDRKYRHQPDNYSQYFGPHPNLPGKLV